MPVRGEDLNNLGAAEPLLAQRFRELGKAPNGGASEHRALSPARISDEHHIAAKLKVRNIFDQGDSHARILSKITRLGMRSALNRRLKHVNDFTPFSPLRDGVSGSVAEQARPATFPDGS